MRKCMCVCDCSPLAAFIRLRAMDPDASTANMSSEP